MNTQTMAQYRHLHWLFLGMLIAGVVGFYPSYFSRLRETDLPHHFHGITATAWMSLLIAQALLMRLRRIPQHRALGKVSYVIAPLFLASGLLMVWTILTNTDPFSTRFGVRLAVVDLTTLAYFAIAYVLAIRHRRNIHLHARFMASTGLMILPPALARLAPAVFPWVQSFEAAFDVGYLCAELVVLILLVFDLRPGRVRLPFSALLAFLLAQHAVFHLMSLSEHA